MSSQHASGTKGSRHWWWQRVSAVALIPLTLWFMFAVVDHIGDDYATVVGWIGQPYVAILLVLYLGFMLFHGQLGVREIIEDYVHDHKLKSISLLVIKVILIVSALAGLYSILHIAL